ncbi:hypothetical protein NBRC116598_41900 [Pseudophaeobacter arcticus]|uniref:Uncharacterized protein n=1 Tax=Pseudophaeobacter arcticus TaxID=385492 RepID=A0ABQ0ASD4_9RHOB
MQRQQASQWPLCYQMTERNPILEQFVPIVETGFAPKNLQL